MAMWFLKLYTSLVWWCYFFNTPSNCMGSQSDQLSLMAFKAAIHDPLGALNSWNASSNYCSWNGVICSLRHPNRVISLSFMSQGLVGRLSPHIGNLSFLRRINLQNNSFHGHIPQEMGRLTRLRYIELSNNTFDGEIPNNLSRCSSLQYLNLIDNNLTGIIPPELGQLSYLQDLGLTRNKLSGIIPPTIGNLSSLFQISLAECGLQGPIPETIGKLNGLNILRLWQNNLSGNVPPELYNISTISFIVLISNQLEGGIPLDLGTLLPNLEVFDVGQNRFSGRIPTSLPNASKLELVGFYSNHFTGPMPNDLGTLTGLQTFHFYENRLEDDLNFLYSLTNCSKLTMIDVAGNLLRGPFPNITAHLSTQLSYLGVGDNQVHGHIPSGIGSLTSLVHLSMEMNHLTGPIPSTIGKLHLLQDLHLAMNQLTELPNSLGNLSFLSLMNSSHNNFQGTLPLGLASCHYLIGLDLSHNNFSGSIPPEILKLSSLSIILRLAHNMLTGFLPPEVGSLTNLEDIDLSNNRLSGTIPNSLGDCSSLQLLHLQANSFEGEIPQGFSDLKGLILLDISDNKLSGMIPTYLGELHLQKLNMSFNRLHGEVPKKGVFQDERNFAIDGNDKLCGGIMGLKLPSCPSPTAKKQQNSKTAKIIVPLVIFVCLTISVCIILFVYRRKISRKKNLAASSFGHQFSMVSYAELLKATDGFSETNLIGIGGYSRVFKGILEQTLEEVAVKVFNLDLRGGFKSFMTECRALRTIRHRNLLKILTVCSGVDFQGNDFKALVYEYMKNGSLDKWLHGQQEERFQDLNLMQRMNIAIDIAMALVYLHSGNESSIVHGDLKPSNVLLDEEMTAHVGDFGLTKFISGTSSDQSNSIASTKGTVGYVAPEYGMNNSVSTEGDVYSYGILLLELFTGRRPTDDAFGGDLDLHNFVKAALPEQAMKIVDPRMGLENETTSLKECLVSILRIGVECSVELPKGRLEMEDVVSELVKLKRVYMEQVSNRR